MPQVQRIDPIVLPSEKESVAAYCRVSTDSADQLNSYHSQIAYYTKLINDNPDWELYDLYADRGITGTSMENFDYGQDDPSNFPEPDGEEGAEDFGMNMGM